MRVDVQFCRCRQSREEREADQGYDPSNGGASSENMRVTNGHLGNSSFYWPIEATSRFGKGGKIDLAQVVGSRPIVVEAEASWRHGTGELQAATDPIPNG